MEIFDRVQLVVEALSHGPVKSENVEEVNRKSRDSAILTVTVGALVVAMSGRLNVDDYTFLVLFLIFVLFVSTSIISEEERGFYLHLISVLCYSIGILLLLWSAVSFISKLGEGGIIFAIYAVGGLGTIVALYDVIESMKTTIMYVLECQRAMTDQEETERPTPDDGACPECGETIPADSVLTVTICPSCEMKIGATRCTPSPPGCGKSYPNSLTNCPSCNTENT